MKIFKVYPNNQPTMAFLVSILLLCVFVGTLVQFLFPNRTDLPVTIANDQKNTLKILNQFNIKFKIYMEESIF